ncbi:MAG: DoxX family protein [Burkholderiaceae bacterium]
MTQFVASPALAANVRGIVRIVVAYLLLTHGSAKFFGIPHVAYFDNLQLFSLIGAAGVLEIGGGLLLLVGWGTRPVAFVLSGFLAFAYFIGHASKGFFFVPMMNQGEAAVLFSFILLYLAVAGGGAFSVDAARNKA